MQVRAMQDVLFLTGGKIRVPLLVQCTCIPEVSDQARASKVRLRPVD